MQEQVELAVDAIGARLLKTLVTELNNCPHPTVENQSVWSAMPEHTQAASLDRMGAQIRAALAEGYAIILKNETPAVRCELSEVTFKSGAVIGKLKIPTTSKHRHELSDFAGYQVIVVMARNLDEYLQDMEDIVAETDQGELDLDEKKENLGDAEYDVTVHTGMMDDAETLVAIEACAQALADDVDASVLEDSIAQEEIPQPGHGFPDPDCHACHGNGIGIDGGECGCVTMLMTAKEAADYQLQQAEHGVAMETTEEYAARMLAEGHTTE